MTSLLLQMRLKLSNKDLYVTREGAEELPTVVFRQVNPFKLWIWVGFYQVCKGGYVFPPLLHSFTFRILTVN